MKDESLIQRVLHLRQVEKLSQQQIAQTLGIGRKRVRGMLKAVNGNPRRIEKKLLLDSYLGLIAEWYRQYPRLQAKQIFERLLPYGYTGSYMSVARVTEEYRRVRPKAYHPLVFLPGEEAQVDWFFADLPGPGRVAGFLYVLSYSRYAWGVFYPRTTFEFFLAGHMECFRHLGGLAHRHRYDNLKSVVLARDPEIRYNPQFLEFARFFGFSIHACNPYSGNEKGRVERFVRVARSFLYGETFRDLADLNGKFHVWLTRRNSTAHRSTEKPPVELRAGERLVTLPAQPYPARRVELTRVLTTAQVECDTNKYSVPTSCAGQNAELCIYPAHVEVWVSGQKVATHKREFGRRQAVSNPLHAEKLLDRTPGYRMRRILQLVTGMDPAFLQFIGGQDDDSGREQAAYQLFTLLRTHSRVIVVSAVRELAGMGCYKVKALQSRLCLPEVKAPPSVWPKDANLLNLTYQERTLDEYNPNS